MNKNITGIKDVTVESITRKIFDKSVEYQIPNQADDSLRKSLRRSLSNTYKWTFCPEFHFGRRFENDYLKCKN